MADYPGEHTAATTGTLRLVDTGKNLAACVSLANKSERQSNIVTKTEEFNSVSKYKEFTWNTLSDPSPPQNLFVTVLYSMFYIILFSVYSIII